MSNDYRADPLSNQAIENHVLAFKRKLGFRAADIPSPIDILRRQVIPTRFRPKPLRVTLLRDDALKGDEARTLATKDRVDIEVADKVWRDAGKDDPRALMTLAHEIAHAYLHEKSVPLARTKPAFETERPRYLGAYESAEHQAKYFASALRMPKEVVTRFVTAETLAEACKVNLTAAKIRMEQCALEIKREIPASIRSIIDDLHKNSHAAPPRRHQISKDALVLWDNASLAPWNGPNGVPAKPFRVWNKEN